MARLVLLSEGFTGQTCELKAEKTTVGRLPDNAFQIADASVSSHHAEIFLRGKDVVVRDLDSTNGTFINNERVTEGVLKPGQIVRLGMIDLRLETGEVQPLEQKRLLDQTRVIPKGVKLDELESMRAPLDLEQKGFEKKSNKATLFFIIAAGAIGLVLLGALCWVLFLKK
jgi:pSer/pThr/pTyr-binding forkhead associated (FHA) protein